jgi:hypothetical protein
VLELPIEEVPDIHPEQDWDDWHAAWDDWLATKGIAAYDVKFGGETKVKGYTIATVPSRRFENTLHSIVCLDGEPVWDPVQDQERPYAAEEIDSHYLLVPIDPSVLVKNGPEKEEVPSG